MENARHIRIPRLWLISGLLTLLLIVAALLLLPTSSTQAASAQGCKDKGQVTVTQGGNGQKTTQGCTKDGAKGPKTTVFCTTGGAKGKDTGGSVTIKTNTQTQGASSKGCTCVVQGVTGKDTKGTVTIGQGCNCTTTATKDKNGITTASCTVDKKRS